MLSHIDGVPELVRLRTVAARFFMVVLWLHVPVILTMAARGGIDLFVQGPLLAFLVIVPTLLALRTPNTFATRMALSVAMTFMPILMVYDNPGPLQIEYTFYFFVVSAMLVAFVDWRCVVVAASLAAGHHLLFALIAPERTFSVTGVFARGALYDLMAAIECGALVWIIAQLRRLLLTADRVQALAEANAAVASTDILTQLPNRRAFVQDLAREMARVRRHHSLLTLALVDVDEFKSINDRSGHLQGDHVLVSLAAVLRTMRGEDRAYRIGGDEFAVLLVESDGPKARGALERVRDRSARILGGPTVSVGYVTVTEKLVDLDPFELADAALYEAKRRGRNGVVGFEQLSEKTAVLAPRKASALKKLIDEEFIAVAFQPVWDIDSGRPFGFEALARPDDELGLSGPIEAFELAERAHLVPQLDRLCVRKVLAAAHQLPRDATVFINVTAAWLESVGFDPHWIVQTAAACGVVPQRIVLEVTERRITDIEALVEHARELADLGVRLALDDACGERAGLEILGKCGFAFVKIEQSLLMRALDDKVARGVLAGVATVARENGSYIIAEGIENERLLEFVRSVPRAQEPSGIRGVQGYLLGTPQIGKVDELDLLVYGTHLTVYRREIVA